MISFDCHGLLSCNATFGKDSSQTREKAKTSSQEKIPSSLLGYLLGFFFVSQQDRNLSDGWESETVPNVIFVGYY